MENMIISSGLSPAERQFAAAYLEGSRALLLSRVRGLPPAVLAFRPGPSEWSVADCIEHCSAAEAFGWQWMQAALQTPPIYGGGSLQGDGIISLMTDRSRPSRTLPILEPSGQSPDPAVVLRQFASRRQSFISYVLQTNDPLKDHFVVHPLTGRIDLYQLLVLQS